MKQKNWNALNALFQQNVAYFDLINFSSMFLLINKYDFSGSEQESVINHHWMVLLKYIVLCESMITCIFLF